MQGSPRHVFPSLEGLWVYGSFVVLICFSVNPNPQAVDPTRLEKQQDPKPQNLHPKGFEACEFGSLGSQGVGFSVEGLGRGVGLRDSGFRFRVSEFRVSGSGASEFRVKTRRSLKPDPCNWNPTP